MDLVIRLIGSKVRRLRKSQGLSQQQLGEKAGFDYRYVGFIEQARVNPTIKTLEKVAGALNITVAELLPTSDEIAGGKKGSAHKYTEQELIKSKIVKHLNKVDNKTLKKINRIVNSLVE